MLTALTVSLRPMLVPVGRPISPETEGGTGLGLHRKRVQGRLPTRLVPESAALSGGCGLGARGEGCGGGLLACRWPTSQAVLRRGGQRNQDLGLVR